MLDKYFMNKSPKTRSIFDIYVKLLKYIADKSGISAKVGSLNKGRIIKVILSFKSLCLSTLYLKNFTYISKFSVVFELIYKKYLSNMLAVFYSIKDYTIKITY